MYWTEACAFSWWWLFPIIMMILCFFMMRSRRGTMMCGCGPRSFYRRQTDDPDSALEILDRRYASGEIDQAEYAEKKRHLTASVDPEVE